MEALHPRSALGSVISLVDLRLRGTPNPVSRGACPKIPLQIARPKNGPPGNERASPVATTLRERLSEQMRQASSAAPGQSQKINFVRTAWSDTRPP